MKLPTNSQEEEEATAEAVETEMARGKEMVRIKESRTTTNLKPSS